MTTKGNATVLIRLKVSIASLVANDYTHPKRGDVIEVEPSAAEKYFACGYAQPVGLKELGDPYRAYTGPVSS